MGKVNLRLTKAQLKKLVRLVYLGEWMCNSYRVEDKLDFNDVEQELYKKALDAGLTDWFTTDKDEVYPSQILEEHEETRGLIEEFEKQTFWDELENRLADRLLADTYSEKEWATLGRTPAFMLRCDAADQVRDVLNERGLDAIEFKGAPTLPSIAAVKQKYAEYEDSES